MVWKGYDNLGKFSGLLFCTDLDGTLYSDDKTVSKENLDAIEYFKSEGGLFTFITGRVPQTSVHICNTIKPNAPFGCFNGGAVYDPVTEKYLYTILLPKEASELIDFVDRNLPEIGIQLTTEENAYFLKDSSAFVLFRELTGLPFLAADFDEEKEPVLRVAFAHTDGEKMDELIRLLESHPKSKDFDLIRSEKIYYEILPKGVSKGLALTKIAELLGIDPKNTIAVGDYNNDISMIKAAGIGFAVENAVEEAKAAADFITVSNNDSAIAAIVNYLDGIK